MPAWMTSLLRELVPVPKVGAESRTSTSLPLRASSLATASPTTPAPITTHSALSLPISARAAFVHKLLRLIILDDDSENEDRKFLSEFLRRRSSACFNIFLLSSGARVSLLG